MRSETKTFYINPYIAGAPVKNPTMFFGRDDVYAWLRRHLRGRYQDNVIVLYGERRSGKTSVLYQMGEHLGDKTYVPVLIDFQSMSLEGVDGFLWEIARKIILSLRGVEGVPLLDRPARRDFEENARHNFEEVFLPPILAALGERHLLLMFDETNRLEERITSGDLPPEVINYLRSFIQHSNHINFIFSLGSRVEEAQRLSFELFNLAVYRKISFLEQDFAEDLITKPVAQYYTYTRPAIDRIFELTSGHPYYTQLLCHNLFTHWAEHKPPQLDLAAVNLVVPEIIEQATPNLQFTWDDSTPVEKAILATLASRLPEYGAGIMRRSVDRALRRAELFPPTGDVTTGLKRLFERDVINRQEPYKFRVGFVQLWLTEFKQLDWVYEELGDQVDAWRLREEKRQAEAPTPVEQARRWAIPVLTGVALGGLLAILFFWYTVPPSPSNASEVNELATQVAALQSTATAAIEDAETVAREGNAEELGVAQATAQAAIAEAATVQAQVTAAIENALVVESTKLAAEIQAAATQGAAAQATATAGQRELATLENILETSTTTPSPTSPATDTATPAPTFTPSATRLPTATPTPRPNGRLAIPVDNQVGRYNVHIFSVSTGDLLSEIITASQPQFSPAGDQLAVKAERGDADTIWIYDPNGGNPRLASPAASDSRPAWSPDGQRLVYENQTTPKDGRQVWRIFVQNDAVRPTSNDVAMLAGDILDADRPLYPLWSDEGEIIFSACNYWVNSASASCGIWRTPATATVTNSGFQFPKNITTQREIPTDLDGKRLLLMGERSQAWEVFLTSTGAGNLTNLTNNSANDGLGVFSPDGYWVAFISDRGGAWGVWVVPASGGAATRLPIEGLRFASGERNWTTERMTWGP